MKFTMRSLAAIGALIAMGGTDGNVIKGLNLEGHGVSMDARELQDDVTPAPTTPVPTSDSTAGPSISPAPVPTSAAPTISDSTAGPTELQDDVTPAPTTPVPTSDSTAGPSISPAPVPTSAAPTISDSTAVPTELQDDVTPAPTTPVPTSDSTAGPSISPAPVPTTVSPTTATASPTVTATDSPTTATANPTTTATSSPTTTTASPTVTTTESPTTTTSSPTVIATDSPTTTTSSPTTTATASPTTATDAPTIADSTAGPTFSVTSAPTSAAPTIVELTPEPTSVGSPGPTLAPTLVSAQESILDTVVASEDHTTLEAAVLAASEGIAASLDDPAQTLTLFAPDDDAFETLPDGTVELLTSTPWQPHLDCVLLGHVSPDVAVPSSDIFTGPLTVESAQPGYELNLDAMGMGVTVNDIAVSVPDINATNGIIHSLSEGVLLPPCVTQNIADVLSANDDFSTLVELVTAADLIDALSRDPTAEGLTVMAPNNDAFVAVPADILTFLAGNVTALTEVLTYHVIPANVIPTGSGTVTTLQGEDIEVTVDGKSITLNESSEVQGTTLASNGVIHEISAVLLPPNLDLPEGTPTPTPEGPTLAPTSEPTPVPTEEEASCTEFAETLAAVLGPLGAVSCVSNSDCEAFPPACCLEKYCLCKGSFTGGTPADVCMAQNLLRH